MCDYVGKSTSPLDHPGAAGRVVARGPVAGGVARPQSGSRTRSGDPPGPFASLSREVRDPALARLIGGLRRRSAPRTLNARRNRPRPRTEGPLTWRLYLVTGGAGFIGSSLARALVARGDTRPRHRQLLAPASARTWPTSPTEIELLEGDIRDDRAAGAGDRTGVEVVFHEAAIASVPQSMAEPLENHAVNATGTLRVLEAARRAGVRRVVYAASSAAYGDEPGAAQGRDHAAGADLALRRQQAGRARSRCRSTRARYGLETVCLRYFNVFGPRQDPKSEYAAVIPKFITAALAGKQPRIFGDGTQSRDFCHIDNVIEANFAAAAATRAAASGGVFNIGCGAGDRSQSASSR